MRKSLKQLDGQEGLQSIVTNNAMLFAALTLEEAKKNSLTREQIIKEGEVKKTIRSS